MSAGTLALELRGIPWREVVVGGFVCNGFECQFMGAYMIDTGYPAVTVTSHVIDLSSKMGVHLATAFFRKLEALVRRYNGRKWDTILDESSGEDQMFEYMSKNVFVRVGALKRYFKDDLDSALRHNLHIFKELVDLRCVVHPIGMMTGMTASRERPHKVFEQNKDTSSVSEHRSRWLHERVAAARACRTVH